MAIFKFQNDGCPLSRCEKFEILTADGVQGISTHHSAKFRDHWSSRCRHMAIFLFFQNGGRPPSWICCACVWTIGNEYLELVLFIV